MAQSMHRIRYLHKPDHSWMLSSEELLGLLMDIHLPGSSENYTVEYTQDSGAEIDYTPIHIVSKINVRWAIKSFEPFKSSGPDGPFLAQLQQVQNNIIDWLVTILKGVLQLNHVPSLWMKVKVIYIPKEAKSSHTSPKDFRPISPSSFLQKRYKD